MNYEEKIQEEIELFKFWAQTYKQRFNETMFKKVVSEQGLFMAHKLVFDVFRKYEELLHQK